MMMLPAPACTMQGLIVRAGCPYVDPDLQQALAASQTDEELRHAIQASLQDQKQSVPTASSTHTAKGQGNVSRGGLSAPFAPSGMSPASQTPPSPSEPVLLTAKAAAQQAVNAQADLLAEVAVESDPCQVLTAGSGKQHSQEAALADKRILSRAKPAHRAGSASQNQAGQDDVSQASKLLEAARQRAAAKAAAAAVQSVASKAVKDKTCQSSSQRAEGSKGITCYHGACTSKANPVETVLPATAKAAAKAKAGRVSSVAADNKAASQTGASGQADSQAVTIPALHSPKTRTQRQATALSYLVTGPPPLTDKQQQQVGLGWGEQGSVGPPPLVPTPTTAGQPESNSSPEQMPAQLPALAAAAQAKQVTQQAAAQEASPLDSSASKAAAAVPK
ncbi:hypothetical protein ABBQ38_007008 [Trebouxia sp. C0009 RCD-2024]